MKVCGISSTLLSRCSLKKKKSNSRNIWFVKLITSLSRIQDWHMYCRRKWYYFACCGTCNSSKRYALWRISICSKMDNKCPFHNFWPFSANHWMAMPHFVSHFTNLEDNGSYLWPRKLFSINYSISHKASPFLPFKQPTHQMKTIKYCNRTI